MKRTKGICRNRLETFQLAKDGVTRKKNIFKIIGKEDDLSQETLGHNNHLLSSTTKNSSTDREPSQSAMSLDIYEQAKGRLKQVAEYRKKMTSQIKLRMSSFKDSQIKAYDDNITKYSTKSVDHLVKCEKILVQIRNLKGLSPTEQKLYRNMERSLGMQILQVSRSLRAQQKDYFQRLKALESGSANLAIQLCQQDRQRMKDEFDEMQVCQTEMGDDQQRNKQIAELVKTINQLSSIYKQLNELVIEQGSLIDRIDFNIQQTCQHVQRGVQHLKGADQHASNSVAQKCMCILIILILSMACVLGFKLSKS